MEKAPCDSFVEFDRIYLSMIKSGIVVPMFGSRGYSLWAHSGLLPVEETILFGGANLVNELWALLRHTVKQFSRVKSRLKWSLKLL